MKTVYKSLIGLVLIALAGSCQPEFDPGETAAVGFSGEWYYQIWADDTLYQDFDYHGDVLLTYGTANDVADEIWIDDQDNGPFYMKSMFTITGTPEAFEGTGELAPNEYNIAYYGDPAYPDEDGVEVKDTIYDIIAVEFLSGEILQDVAKVYADLEQAPTDSIRLVVAGYGGILNYITREVMYHEIDSTVDPVVDTIYPIYVLDRQEPFIDTFHLVSDTLVYQGHKQTGWEVYL